MVFVSIPKRSRKANRSSSVAGEGLVGVSLTDFGSLMTVGIPIIAKIVAMKTPWRRDAPLSLSYGPGA